MYTLQFSAQYKWKLNEDESETSNDLMRIEIAWLKMDDLLKKMVFASLLSDLFN